MDIKFLGTGGVFDFEYGNSSCTVDLEHRILVDCGPSVFPRLVQTSSIKSIDALLLTHLHGDHVGSIFQLIFFMKGKLSKELQIIYPTEDFKNEIAVLLGAMGVPNTHYSFKSISEYDGISYIDTTGKHAKGVTSFAYTFTDPSETVYYSGDLGDINVTKDFLEKFSGDKLRIFHEMHHISGPSHVHYLELARLLGRWPVFAYHCNPERMPKNNIVPLVHEHPKLNW